MLKKMETFDVFFMPSNLGFLVFFSIGLDDGLVPNARQMCYLNHRYVDFLGLYSREIKRQIHTVMGIPITNRRRSDDRLMFIMGILIPIRRCLLNEYRPCMVHLCVYMPRSHICN